MVPPASVIWAVQVSPRPWKFKNKIGAAFCPYGWSGEAVKLIEGHLNEFGIPVAAAGVRAKWPPTEDDLKSCHERGREIAAVVKE